jgi:hypothetical protein
MAFGQLYYTSCATGLSGFAGFQFNAASAGISPVMMREVEQLTVYEPPEHLSADPDPAELSGYPVNLLHTFSEADGTAIVAQTVFTGRDFSHRPGNYFAHTLVAGPADDLAGTLPIELWESRLWRTEPVNDPRLPAISGALPRGPLSRENVVADLGSAAGERLLATMLSAVQESMTGAGPPVLIIAPDSTAVARWIAAVSYLLGTRLSRELTFSTYNHRPDYCRTHMVGAVGLTAEYTAACAPGFHVFDLVSGECAELPLTPPAVLLARVGVIASEPLWRQAIELGTERHSSLADWFPALTVAAMSMEVPLTPEELDAAVGRLADAAAEPGVEELVAMALGQPIDRLSPQRQRQLVELAPSEDLVADIELILVRSAFERLDNDEPLGQVMPLTGERSRTEATAQCRARVGGTTASRAVPLLAWAGEAGIPLSDEEVRRCGAAIVAPELLDGRTPPQLETAARGWPVLRAGIVEGISQAGPRRRRDALRLLASLPFTDDDFADHPALSAAWTVESVRLGRIPPVTGLLRVLEHFNASSLDQRLLEQLWPSGHWSAEEARQLFMAIPAEDFRQGILHDWLLAVVNEPPPRATEHVWTALLRDLATSPTRPLPEPEWEEVRLLLTLAQALTHIQADQESSPTPEEYARFYSLYEASGPSARTVLERRLPVIIVRTHPNDTALEVCPSRLFDVLCRHLRQVLGEAKDVEVAAWTFVVMRRLFDNRSTWRAKRLETEVLLPTVLDWRGKTVASTVGYVDRYARNTGKNFQLWHLAHRGDPQARVLRAIGRLRGR